MGQRRLKKLGMARKAQRNLQQLAAQEGSLSLVAIRTPAPGREVTALVHAYI